MAHSKADLNADKQILYLAQWFTEFSDFQRNDLLNDHLIPLYGPLLKSLFRLDSNGEQDTSEITNGIESMWITNVPPSIFQCRMKLLTEWYDKWCDNDRFELLTRLRNIDSSFINEFYRVFLRKHHIINYQMLEQMVKQDMLSIVERLGLVNVDIFNNENVDVTVNNDAQQLQQMKNNETNIFNGGEQQKDQTPDLLNDVNICDTDGGNCHDSDVGDNSGDIQVDGKENSIECDIPVVEDIIVVEPLETSTESQLNTNAPPPDLVA